MSRNEYERETISKYGLDFEAIWEYDECPDTSWMGEWLAKEPSYGKHYVDRNTGDLFSGYVKTETRTFQTADIDDTHDAEVDISDTYETVAIKGKPEDVEWLRYVDEHSSYEAVLSDDTKTVTITADVAEVLATGLYISREFDRHSAEYWGKCQHLPYKKSNWDACTVNHDALTPDEEKRISDLRVTINREGRTPDEIRSILYACEDHNRMERLCDGDWCFLDLHVELEFEGETFESSYCGGYESDMSESDKMSVINEHISEIMHELPEAIDAKIKALVALKRIINPAEYEKAVVVQTSDGKFVKMFDTIESAKNFYNTVQWERDTMSSCWIGGGMIMDTEQIVTCGKEDE